MLLPLIGEGRDGECPARALFFFVILNSGAGRNVIQNPLQNQSMRHTGLDPVSPASLEGFKINSVLCNPSNYATPARGPEWQKRNLAVLFRGTNKKKCCSEWQKYSIRKFAHALPGGSFGSFYWTLQLVCANIVRTSFIIICKTKLSLYLICK